MKRTALILIAVLAIGCVNHKPLPTVAPRSVVTHQASFDDNEQNSGIVAADENGFIVTPHFIERHQISTTEHGVTSEGKNYRISGQIMSKSIEQDRQRKNKQE